MPRKPCPDCAAWQARYDRLLDHLLTKPAPRAGRVLPPPPDADTLALQRVEEAILEHEAEAVAAMRNVSLDAARAEVRRIRGLALETRIDPD